VIAGRPAISYWDYNNSDLKYVRAYDADGSTWGTPFVVDSVGNVGTFTSMLSLNGYPAISYCDETNGDLKFARLY
jgi:hypothetical protein